MEKEYIELGKTLARIRIRAGLNQTRAAKLIGISRVSLTNYENGKQRVLYHNAVRLLEKFRKLSK